VQALQEAAAGGDEVAVARLQHFAALLGALRDLPGKPVEESSTFKRVRQARRHELWRVAHPYHPAVAVRIIVWFPPAGGVVVAVFSFDKAAQGDVWYARAAREGENAVDQLLRERPELGSPS
jgi:hypothetical protein